MSGVGVLRHPRDHWPSRVWKAEHRSITPTDWPVHHDTTSPDLHRLIKAHGFRTNEIAYIEYEELAGQPWLRFTTYLERADRPERPVALRYATTIEDNPLRIVRADVARQQASGPGSDFGRKDRPVWVACAEFLVPLRPEAMPEWWRPA